MTAVVFGNVSLDVICFPVVDVPRHDSITLEKSIVAPGGCASNVAIGLSRMGTSPVLVARVGDDDAAVSLRAIGHVLGSTPVSSDAYRKPPHRSASAL